VPFAGTYSPRQEKVRNVRKYLFLFKLKIYIYIDIDIYKDEKIGYCIGKAAKSL